MVCTEDVLVATYRKEASARQTPLKQIESYYIFVCTSMVRAHESELFLIVPVRVCCWMSP